MEVDFSEYLFYDPTSPTCLRWVRQKNIKFGQKVRYGDVAGTFVSKQDGRRGSVSVRISSKHHKAHRIVWEIFNGPIPDGMIIDHLNGNPWDNRIENLACKSITQNSQNRSRNKNNKSGTPNIYFIKTKNYPDGVWIVKICCHGEKYSKSFSIKKYKDEAENAAKTWRISKLSYLNQQERNIYTERHINGD